MPPLTRNTRSLVGGWCKCSGRAVCNLTATCCEISSRTESSSDHLTRNGTELTLQLWKELEAGYLNDTASCFFIQMQMPSPPLHLNWCHILSYICTKITFVNGRTFQIRSRETYRAGGTIVLFKELTNYSSFPLCVFTFKWIVSCKM